MTLWKAARMTRQAASMQSAARNPGGYVRRRAVSKGLGVLGVWRVLARLFR